MMISPFLLLALLCVSTVIFINFQWPSRTRYSYQFLCLEEATDSYRRDEREEEITGIMAAKDSPRPHLEIYIDPDGDYYIDIQSGGISGKLYVKKFVEGNNWLKPKINGALLASLR